MTIVPDLKINSQVRSLLASHWVDLQYLNIGSYHGTVRLNGELRYLGARDGLSTDAAKLELIEGEVRRVKGVKRVHLDLLNWRKNHKGLWETRLAIVRQILEDRDGVGHKFEAVESPVPDPAPEAVTTSPR